KARAHSVQCLQIQLLLGLGWNKASCRPLHGLSYRMGISEIILVPLPKRLCIRGRNLLHIVAKLGKLTSNIVCRHPCFDTNEAGRQIHEPRWDAYARDLVSQYDGATRIETDHVKCVLAHIYSNGDHSVNRGCARHGVLLLLISPSSTLSVVGGGSAAGPSHSRTSRDVRLESAKWAKADFDRSLSTNRNL